MIIIPCSGMFPNVRIFARNLEPDDLGRVSPTNRKILFHSSHGIPGISNRNIWSNGKLPLCFVSRAEQLCPEMNAYGRTFHGGKSIEKHMRWLIIDDILSGGGNVWTEYYPGSFRAIGSKCKVSGVPVSNVWMTFCQTRENLPLHAAARGQPKKLAEPELDLVRLLIKCRPSRTSERENDLEKDDEAYRRKRHPW